MALKVTTSKDAVAEYFDKVHSIIAKQMKKYLSLLGEECVNRIRKKHANDWKDRTGNLRSSIGYAICDRGKTIVQSKFEVILKGNAGSAKGKAYVQELAEQYANVYALVVVAGMDYASHVEHGGKKNRKPRDVLASTTLWAEGQINKYLDMAMETAVEHINRIKLK